MNEPEPKCCVLCGIPVPLPADNNVDPRLSYCRAIYTYGRDWNASRLSLPQTRQEFEDGSYAIQYEPAMDGDPIDADPADVDPGSLFVPFRPMETVMNEDDPDHCHWGFLFHESCWQIFAAHCTSHGTSCDIQALFDILRSYPIIGKRVMNWGHDYEGAHFRVEFNETGSYPNIGFMLWPDGDRPDYRFEDPMNIPALQTAFRMVRVGDGEARTLKESVWNCKSREADSSDPFAKLPREILCQILENLDSEDALSVKQSSSICDSVTLPVTFWHSRFWPDGELGHVFEAESMYLTREQWQHLWHRATTLDAGDTLRNRRTIWELSDRLRRLLEQRIAATTCHGAAVKSFFEPSAPESYQAWTVAKVMLWEWHSVFPAGARAIWQRSISLPKTFGTIFVSWVWTWNQKYVSGLRITQEDEPSVKIGYIRPAHETTVTWVGGDGDGDDGILAFHLSMDTSGIRGLAVETLLRGTSLWTGESEGIPRRRLLLPGHSEPQERKHITALQASFDTLKMVSLSIACDEKIYPPNTEDTLRSAQLWYPDLPPLKVKVLGLHHDERNNYVPHIPSQTYLFGGEDGRHLQFLEEIVVWYGKGELEAPEQESCNIAGIEFKYTRPVDGKQSLIIGERGFEAHGGGADKEVLSLKAGQGERITQIEPLYLHLHQMNGLKLLTNFGQRLEVPSLRTWPPQLTRVSKIHKPERGTIVGLVVKMDRYRIHYDLGVMYIDEEV